MNCFAHFLYGVHETAETATVAFAVFLCSRGLPSARRRGSWRAGASGRRRSGWTSSTPQWSGSTPITESSDGNYIFYGVREFGMTAIASGLALHGGFVPYTATFLIFMEYNTHIYIHGYGQALFTYNFKIL